jgi:hypothetical protein
MRSSIKIVKSKLRTFLGDAHIRVCDYALLSQNPNSPNRLLHQQQKLLQAAQMVSAEHYVLSARSVAKVNAAVDRAAIHPLKVWGFKNVYERQRGFIVNGHALPWRAHAPAAVTAGSETTTRPKKIKLDQKCAKLKAKVLGLPLPIGQEMRKEDQKPKTYTLKEAAKELGRSYSTTRRLLIEDVDVERCSATNGKGFFPSMSLKRFQRVRMTWVIPQSSIDRVRRRMRGQQSDVA